jgi:tryptophan 2,3-dioxygenase
MTPAAKELVINRLRIHEFSSKHKSEVMRIIKFIENGAGSDGTEFLRKMQQTDEFRKETMLTTHREIAKAMGYE